MDKFIILAAYCIGSFLALWMIRTEHEAEGNEYTKMDRIVAIIISLHSFVAVTVILWSTWVKSINRTGYWSKSAKQ